MGAPSSRVSSTVRAVSSAPPVEVGEHVERVGGDAPVSDATVFSGVRSVDDVSGEHGGLLSSRAVAGPSVAARGRVALVDVDGTLHKSSTGDVQ